MGNNEKQGVLGISVKTAKIVLCMLLVFNAVIFIVYGVIVRSDELNTESVQYLTDWTVEADEQDFFTCAAILPKDIQDNEYLFFNIRKDVTIYINDEFRQDFIEERDVKSPGGSVKRYYMMVPLKSSDAGGVVKVVRSSDMEIEHKVPDTFIGTRYAAIVHLIRQGGLSFLLALIVLIFSIVVIIVSVVLGFSYKMKLDMMYGALGIFVIASWIITDSDLWPFIFGVYHVNGIINNILSFCIPFAPCIYLNAVQHGHHKRTISFILIASALNAIIWPPLHFMGILPFYSVSSLLNAILSVISIAALAILIADAISGRSKEYRYTFVGFFGFLVCCIIELLLLTLGIYDGAIPMVIGLGFLLTFVVIQQVDDIQNINKEKQHAIDISEAKTKFLASMSHEIRTPINAILGMNEMILRENNDSVIEEYSNSIKTSGKMLLMLVNDVLDFSKIEAGKLEIHENSFQMSDILYDVISLLSERADEKKLELRTELESDIPNEMISDEFRIRQILINLINNAIKYTDKGTVTLKLGGRQTGEGGYELSMRIIDTGKGIRKEEQSTLFEAFSRADVNANVNIEGTGLGLAIVKSIVDSMKGSIGVESEYGVGSEFWVKLPLRYTPGEVLKDDFMERHRRAETSSEAGCLSAHDAKILVVDDNQSNLTIVRLFFKRTGINPDLCNDSKKAIEMCCEKKYDIIFLDHMMPQPDGIEALHIIRSDERSLNKDTKAVVLTANAVAGSRQMYMEAGFDDYLTKPLDSNKLEQTVNQLLPADKLDEIMEFVPESAEPEQDNPSDVSPLRKRLTAIEGLQYDVALGYCGEDEAFLEEIVSDIAAGGAERAGRMSKALHDKDYKAYEIEAHTIKSTMATIGLKDFSETAKKHEFAARENDTSFIDREAESFIQRYLELCEKLKN